MNVYPTALSRLPDGRLRIDWSDDLVRVYAIEQLRNACPCATCADKRAAGEVPRPEELPPLTLSGMKPVGNYAYCLAFGDGHETGIFTYDFLRRLGEPVEDTSCG